MFEEVELMLEDAMAALIEEDNEEEKEEIDAAETPYHIPIEKATLLKSKVVELRDKLRQRNQAVSGKKDQLLLRPREALEK